MKKLLRLFVSIIFVSAISIPIFAQEHWNMDLAGSLRQWDYTWDVEISGDYAYVATSTSGLSVVDISNPEDPFETMYTLDGYWIKYVEIEGDYAYLWDLHDGLRIVDISGGTTQLEQVGFLEHENVSAFCANENLAFAILRPDNNEDYVINIIDVSDPENPELTGQTEGLEQLGHANWHIAARGTFVYLAGNSDMWAVDVSNPNEPVITDRINLGGYAEDIAVEGNLAYIARGYNGISVVDITNPGDLEFIAGQTCPRGSVFELGVENSNLYICAGGGFSIMDFSDPLNVEEITWIQLNLTGLSIANEIFISGGLIGMSNYTAGLNILRFDEEEVEVEHLSHFCPFGDVRKNAVYDDYLYEILSYNLAVKIIDISDPSQPEPVNFFYLDEDMYWGQGSDLKIQDGLLFATDCQNVFIYDLDDPQHPEEIGVASLAYGNGSGTTYFEVFDSLLVTSNSRVLITIDISDPSSPERLDAFGFGDNHRILDNLIIHQGYLYCEAHSSMTIFDLNDPEDIRVVDSIEINSYTVGLEMVGDYLYLLARDELIIYDITDPAEPAEDTSFANISGRQMELDGDKLVIYNTESVIRIFDVSDPLNPEETAWYSQEDNYSARSNFTLDGLMVCNAARNGLFIYELEATPEMVHRPGRIVYTFNNGMETQLPDTIFNIGEGVLELEAVEILWLGDEPEEDIAAVFSNREIEQGETCFVTLDVPEGAFEDSADIEGILIFNTNDLLIPVDTVIIEGEYFGEIVDVSYSNLPLVYELSHPYPNPFNPSLTIPFAVPEPGKVSIGIYDLLGRKVNLVVDWDYQPGRYNAIWNGVNLDGRLVSSGTYYVKMSTENKFSSARKVQLIR
ncbi:MAG: T9SS type A sorting domain-containing protein [Candidatus Electryonea clarkiae]|nr:T9SS type A sorting domain-containing protein [Candidatus Electryonea clarkiae]MDP8289309.1 T9SS type A sorting domain-containing protein [Candidatus Electryonea clarkiae]